MNLLFQFFLLIIIWVSASSEMEAQRKMSSGKGLKSAHDSVQVSNLFKTKSAGYSARLDSLNKVYYIQQLEDISNLQNNRDTYYGAVFGVLAAIFTLIALILGVNWFQMMIQNKKSMNEHRKALADQRKQSENALSIHQGEAKKLFAEQAERFEVAFTNQQRYSNAMKKDLENLKQQNETAISNSLKLIEERLKEHESGQRSDESESKFTDDIKKVQSELNTLKDLLGKTNSVSAGSAEDQLLFMGNDILGRPNFIKCSNCGKIIPLDKFQKSAVVVTTSTPVVQCGRCGELNSLPLGFNRF